MLFERTGFPFNADLAVVHTWADKKNARTLRPMLAKHKRTDGRKSVSVESATAARSRLKARPLGQPADDLQPALPVALALYLNLHRDAFVHLGDVADHRHLATLGL